MSVGEIIFLGNQQVFLQGSHEACRVRIFTIETGDKTRLCAMVATNDTLILHQIMPPCAPEPIDPKTYDKKNPTDIVNDTRRLTPLVQAVFGLETSKDNHRFSTGIQHSL